MSRHWIALFTDERSIVYAAITDLRDRARALDHTADRISADLAAIAWQGFAADAMRRRTRSAIADLRHCAQLHDDAASALEQHRHAALSSPLGLVASETLGVAHGVLSAIGHVL